MRHLSVFAVVLVLLISVSAPAATPPDKVTFQGLLADPAGDPLHGFFDVVAEFYDAPTAGNQIMVEEHLASGSGSVAVNNGRLAVQLGTGLISDGSGPGTYTTLTAVFAAYSEVWIKLIIEGETLSPRVAVASTPLALNSTLLGGRTGDEFLDLSPTPQAKVGRLSATTLAIDGQNLEFAGGATVSSTGGATQITAGTGGSEDLVLAAGAGTGDGGISIEGGGSIDLAAGDGTFTFSDGVTDAVMATLEPGLFTLTGAIEIQGGQPGPGKVLTSDANGRATWAIPSSAPADELTALAELVGFPAAELPPYSKLYDDHCALGASTATLTINGTSAGTVLGWVSTDGISEVYEHRVAFSTGSAVDPDTLIGLETVVQFSRTVLSGSTMTYYRGWITEAAEVGSSGGSRLYAIVLSPKLANMEQYIGSRSFEAQRISDITSEVLAEYAIDHQVAATSVTFEQILQWGESDLQFLMRLWERDGIHFHHVQDDTRVTTTIGHSNSAFPSLATPLRYFGDQNNPGTGEEFISTFRTPRSTFIGNVEVRSFDFVDYSPGLDPISGTATVAGGSGGMVQWNADIQDNTHADHRAGVIADRNKVENQLHRGSGAAADLRGGTIFTLTDTITGDLSDSYLVTRVANFARVAGSCVEYGTAFDAIPSSLPYRPPRTTPQPVVQGAITAKVTDVDDQDETGRVKVAFHIQGDTYPIEAWAPIVAPPGKDRHDVFIPEIDDQVVIDFISSDPFRPFVVGSVVDWTRWDTDPRPLDPDNPWFTPGIGTMVDGHLYMWNRRGNPEPVSAGRFQSIFFRDAGVNDAAWLRFQDTDQTAGAPKFELSHDLHLMQNLVLAGPTSALSGDVNIDGSLMINDGGHPNPDLNVRGTSQFHDDVEFYNSSDIKADQNLSIEANGTLDIRSFATSTWNSGALLDIDSTDLDVDIAAGANIDTGTSLALNSALGSWNVGALLDLDAGIFDIDGSILFMNTTGGTTITAGGSISLDGGTEVVARATTLTFESDTETRVMIDADNDSTDEVASWYRNGVYDAAGWLAHLDQTGDLWIRGALFPGPTKILAQSLPMSEPVRPGQLVSLDPDRPGEVRPTTIAGDQMVLGVASDRPGILFGGPPASVEELESNWGEGMVREYGASRTRLRQVVIESDTKALPMTPEALLIADSRGEIDRRTLKAFHSERFAAIAIAGRVDVAVDASQGAISAGDALSPGSRPGHAVVAREGWPVVGIALESLTEGQGLIKMLVHRSDPAAPAALSSDPFPEEKSAWIPTPGAAGAMGNGGNLTLPLIMSHADDPTNEVLSMGSDGSVSTQASITTGRRGVAELLPVSEAVAGGDVLVVDLDQPGRLRRGGSMADPTVVGVVVDRPGLEIGNNLKAVLAAEPELAAALAEADELGQVDRRFEILAALEAIADESLVPVATGGTADCRVDASYGSIAPGDLLTTSPTPGHAQRTDVAAPGTIIGKALEPLDAGTGTIRILVMLR